jgi:hypothetical protein
MTEDDRFYIPAGRTIIQVYRAFRACVEKMAEAKGEKLDPAWYADSPEEKPDLYKDQPEVLAALWRKRGDEPK